MTAGSRHDDDSNLDAPLFEAAADLLDAAGVGPGEGIVVAVSGGLDSVVLLDLLDCLARPRRLHLRLAHLDHGLREDSAGDADFVAAAARERGWPVTVRRQDVAALARRRGLSLEQAGRQARRRLFAQARAQAGCRWIATGHHADDQAETLLLRLLRGAGGSGLAGIRPVTADGYLRPLLAARRTDLRAYAQARGLRCREDATNADTAIPRNRVRHRLLPDLEAEYNPAVVAALGRTARLLRAEDDYLEQRARAAAAAVLRGRDGTWVALDAEALRGYHLALRRRVLRHYLQQLAQGASVSFGAVERVETALRTAAPGVHVAERDVRAECARHLLVLRRGQGAPLEVPVRVPGVTPIPGRPWWLRAAWIEATAVADLRLDGWHAAFAPAVAAADLVLRDPRPGDRLQPLGMGGRHKKVRACCIDAGWPRLLRDTALVLTRRGAHDEILWVGGLVRCQAYRIDAHTRRVLYLELGGGPTGLHPADRD